MRRRLDAHPGLTITPRAAPSPRLRFFPQVILNELRRRCTAKRAATITAVHGTGPTGSRFREAETSVICCNRIATALHVSSLEAAGVHGCVLWPDRRRLRPSERESALITDGDDGAGRCLIAAVLKARFFLFGVRRKESSPCAHAAIRRERRRHRFVLLICIGLFRVFFVSGNKNSLPYCHGSR